MRVSCKELVRFFDEKTGDNGRDSSAINGVAGEDLGLALLQHYFSQQDCAVEQLAKPVRNAGGGTWLDGWLKVTGKNEGFLYQVEIKNWTAHSKNGRPAPLNAAQDDLRKIARKHWNSIWDEQSRHFKAKEARKCLEKKTSPEADLETRPIICFWWPVSAGDDVSPMFEVEAASPDFSRLWVFSMSLYLRSLQSEHVSLELPRVERRMARLNQFFQK